MSNYLNLSKKQAILRLTDLTDELSNENWRFQLENAFPTTFGQTHDDIVKKKQNVEIGTYQIQQTKFLSKVNDKHFVESLITLFHEHQHTIQYDDYQNDNCDEQLAYSHLAIHNNKSYYEENYKIMLTEIDAEYNGVKNAYRYIANEFSSEIANRLINDYLHEYRPYIINDIAISNESDIDDIFETAYNKATVHQRWLSSYQSDDEIIKFLKENPEYEKPFNKTFDNGYKRDKFIAAVELYYHPEYRDFYSSPAIKNLNVKNYLEKKRELPYIDIPSQDNQKGDEYE